MTHVLTTTELQSIIPETRQLDGKNFSDLKILLIEVIKEVESSGHWEFVQYISGKPSLFIVREKDGKATEKPSQALYSQMPKNNEKNSAKISEQQHREEKSANVNDIAKETSVLFTKTKLPWE